MVFFCYCFFGASFLHTCLYILYTYIYIYICMYMCMYMYMYMYTYIYIYMLRHIIGSRCTILIGAPLCSQSVQWLAEPLKLLCPAAMKLSASSLRTALVVAMQNLHIHIHTPPSFKVDRQQTISDLLLWAI
jgi:hypothetical protein